MADSNQNSNSSQSTQQNNQPNTQNSNNSNAATNGGWVTVNTSDSITAQRMSIMKGDENILITKGDK